MKPDFLLPCEHDTLGSCAGQCPLIAANLNFRFWEWRGASALALLGFPANCVFHAIVNRVSTG